MRHRRFRCWFSVALLVVSVALVVLRAPHLLTSPRLWAEDGSTYLESAYRNSFFGALVFVSWFQGYFMLVSNVPAALAAHMAPLEYAPFFMTYAALVVQVLPLFLLVLGRSRLFENPLHKALGCAIVVFPPHLPGEVWLNTVNVQVYAGLLALLLLLGEPDAPGAGPATRWGRRLILVGAGLSGVYAVFLAPAFAFVALCERTRERVIEASLLAGCALFQAALFAASWLQHTHMPVRTGPGAATFEILIREQLATSLFGRELCAWWFETLAGVAPWAVLALALVLLGPGLRVRRRPTGRQGRRLEPLSILVPAFLLLAAATAFTAIGGNPGGRYALLSQWVVMFGLLAGVRSAGPITTLVCSALLIASLASGVRHYQGAPELRCHDCYREWTLQIARWREDPTRRIVIHPRVFKVELGPPR